MINEIDSAKMFGNFICNNTILWYYRFVVAGSSMSKPCMVKGFGAMYMC